MITLPLLAALMVPPTGPDQISWLIQSTYDYAPASQLCVTTAAEVRPAVTRIAAITMPNGQPLMPAAHVQSWLPAMVFTTPSKSARSAEMGRIYATPGTYIVVTYRNGKWDNPPPQSGPCSGFQTGSNAP